MARSLKKGPFVHYKLDKKVQENIEKVIQLKDKIKDIFKGDK